MHNVFHASLLKPHFGPLPVKRAPVFTVKEDVFEVERILQKRVYCNRIEYLVKWTGYDVFDATWEPLSNLTDC